MALLDDLLKVDTRPFRSRDVVIPEISSLIEANGYKVVDDALGKPWGAFWRFDNSQAGKFIEEFFPELTITEVQRGLQNAELSPKILLVGPNCRLSWQYHNRRAEIWRSVAGPAGYHRSLDDNQGDQIDFATGTIVQFDTSERHRLVSSDGWSIVAEIWQHSDVNHLTDEDDIVRIEDDYNRR